MHSRLLLAAFLVSALRLDQLAGRALVRRFGVRRPAPVL